MTATIDRDGVALMEGILADPHDDVIRLVYADWLEENGEDVRASFIRIQVEIADKDVDFDCKCIAIGVAAGDGPNFRCGSCNAKSIRQEIINPLLQREKELWNERTSDGDSYDFVVDPMAPMDYQHAINDLIPQEALASSECNALIWRRGFPAVARMTLAAWMKHGKGIAAANPITRVILTDKRPSRGRFTDTPNVIRDDLRGKEFWLWECEGNIGANTPSARLPQSIYKWLDGGVSPWHKQYISPDDADDALSEALLTWAKKEPH